MRILLAAVLASGLASGLAACSADGGLYQPSDIPPGQSTPPATQAPQVVLELDLPTAQAIPFIEEVSARCWLDGVVRADAMFVFRESGRIVMTGETEDMLVVDFLPIPDEAGFAKMRLSGPVLTNEALTESLIEHLQRAERGGEIACPDLGDPGKDTPVVAGG
ncbi:MAG: hypothetical protein AAFZ09_04265 [Pseudomonadota bacterium]